jgi:hypothetical protein
MKYYERITECLVKAGRLEAPLWNKIEYHVMRNLDMEYSMGTILNIFLNFALANKGSA